MTSATAPRSERSLAQRLLDRFPAEAARLLEEEAPEAVAALLSEESTERGAEMLRRMTPATASAVLASLEGEPVRPLVAALDPGRAAALLAGADAETRERILGAVSPALAEELRSLMSYPPDTAGALMDPRVLTFRRDAAVRDVVRRLRTLQRKRISDVFLVDEEGCFAGSVSLQSIVLAEPRARLDSLVSGPSPSVQATSSREEVCDILETSHAGSLAVVDFERHLLGVLRQEQLIEAAQQDVAGDLVSMVGASRDERALSPPAFAVRKRLPWLQVNLLTAFLAASVVGIFESTIARFTALAVLLPVVAGQSGNTGAQALAVTMRGLALREVRVRHWVRVAGKELAVGFVNGVAVALTTAIAVYAWSGSFGLALVIGVSMVISMTIAGLSGASIPMILTALKQDPAQSSSIILTTVTDVAGFFSFLGIATLLAGML